MVSCGHVPNRANGAEDLGFPARAGSGWDSECNDGTCRVWGVGVWFNSHLGKMVRIEVCGIRGTLLGSLYKGILLFGGLF